MKNAALYFPCTGKPATLANLKKDSDFNTPVIALTADAVAGAREKYLSLGFDEYIAKPFKKEQLKEVLDKFS